MNKIQLKITVDVEIKQMVEAAAAEKKVSVDDYLLTAVQRQLANDGLVPVHPPLTTDEATQLVKDIRSLRERILVERNGEPIDVNNILEQVRDGRDAELYNLR